MPSSSEEETYSVMFSSLRHSVRRKILRLLATGSRTFTEVLEQVGVEGSFLSYHLESLGELVIKDDGKYALSDLGFAAVSLMTRVEEPLKEVLSSRKTLRRMYPKPLLVVMTFTLIILIGTGIYIGALNTQLERALLEERGRVVNGVSYSLFALSGSGLPGPVGRDEYSNIGLVFFATQNIDLHCIYGRQSLQQLVLLDPSVEKYLQKFDDLFRGFLNFTTAMHRLVSQNETSKALTLIENLFDTITADMEDMSTHFSYAYQWLNKADESILEDISDQASAVLAITNSFINQADYWNNL